MIHPNDRTPSGAHQHVPNHRISIPRHPNRTKSILTGDNPPLFMQNQPFGSAFQLPPKALLKQAELKKKNA